MHWATKLRRKLSRISAWRSKVRNLEAFAGSSIFGEPSSLSPVTTPDSPVRLLRAISASWFFKSCSCIFELQIFWRVTHLSRGDLFVYRLRIFYIQSHGKLSEEIYQVLAAVPDSRAFRARIPLISFQSVFLAPVTECFLTAGENLHYLPLGIHGIRSYAIGLLWRFGWFGRFRRRCRVHQFLHSIRNAVEKIHKVTGLFSGYHNGDSVCILYRGYIHFFR